MEDIFTLIKDKPNTFKDFQHWLFHKLGKNQNSFHNFAKYPNKLKIPYLIEYLEHKGTPILSAYLYYDCLGSSHNMSFEFLSIYLIREEFTLLELKKTINYTPF